MDLAGYSTDRENDSDICRALSVLYLVASSSLVSITRPHHEDVGHGSEGGQVLYRLVSWAILSQTNGVVSHHKDGASLDMTITS